MTPKNLFIAGHTRSGGHFLMNSISMNFDYYQHHKSGKDFHTTSKINVEKINSLIENKSRTIYMSRQQAWSFKYTYQQLRDNILVLYILRDGRDVLGSLFDMHTKEYKWSKCKNINDFMKQPMDQKSYEQKVNIHKAKDPIDSWLLHQKSWIEYFNGTIKEYPSNIIFYEDLYYHFDKTIIKIGALLDMKPNLKLNRPDKYFNSIRPRGGYPGQWKRCFTPEDEKYFNNYVLRHRID